DVYSDRSDYYIAVEREGDSREFSLCQISGGHASCELLGTRAYTMKELNKRKRWEEWQAGNASFLFINVLSGLSYGLPIIAGAGVGTGVVIAIAVGGYGAVAAFFLSKFGPKEQGKQAELFRKQIINDEDVNMKSFSF